MKKIITAIVAVSVLGVLAATLYFATQQKGTIESVLPKDAVAYVHIVDVEKGLADFQKTKLWRSFSKIDVAAIMQRLGAQEQEISGYRKFSKNLSGNLSNPLLLKVFGQEVSLAVYPGKAGMTGRDALSGIIVVTRLVPQAQFLELISSFYGKTDKKISTKQDKYKNFTVTTVDLDNGISLSYVKIKDLLVISFSDSQINACIDVASKTQASLSQDEAYRATLTHFDKPASFVFYMNMQSMMKKMTQAFDVALSKMQKAPDVATKNDMMRSLDKFTGFTSMGVSFSQGEIIKSKFVILYNKSKIDPYLAKSYSFKPMANSSLRFVPRESMWYQWSGYDPKDMWQYFKKELSSTPATSGPSPMDMVKGIEAGLGINLETDVVAHLGNEAGNVLTDIDLNGPIPMPGLMIFTKVSKKETFEKILNSLLEKNNFSTNVTNYKNKSIKYVVLPLGENLQPGFCFLDNYLLIATSHKVLKNCIDAYESQAASLGGDKDFTSLGSGLTEKANQIAYLRSAVLFEKLKGVGDWFVGWMTLVASGAEAFEKAAEQNKAALESDIAKASAQVLELKEKIASLEKSAVGQNTSSPEAVARKSQIEALEKELRSVTQALADKKADMTKIGEMQTNQKKDTGMKPQMLKVLLDEVVYPILEGLKYIKVVGSATTFHEGFIESISYLKTAY